MWRASLHFGSWLSKRDLEMSRLGKFPAQFSMRPQYLSRLTSGSPLLARGRRGRGLSMTQVQQRLSMGQPLQC